VGKLFTPTGIAGTSVTTPGPLLVSAQPFIINWYINRVPGTGWGKDGRRCFCGGKQLLCDPMWHAGSRSGAGASSTNCYTALPLPTTSGGVRQSMQPAGHCQVILNARQVSLVTQCL